ncbi:uncharacterized protein LOC100366307 [Saccoglossus kowalevskii]|uniref:Zinc finger protein 143-like n=1 Tax=Saccoglossus kowalevskii TaxID=10224 RepID=A0ABM0MBN0_SACKO|nr:PREDICTED: zinc finger protein 143-like [Saccoglossus kowalevskii]
MSCMNGCPTDNENSHLESLNSLQSSENIKHFRFVSESRLTSDQPDDGVDHLGAIGKVISDGKEDNSLGTKQDAVDDDEKMSTIDENTLMQAIEPHAGLLRLLSLPNPVSQSPTANNTVLVLSNVDKGGIEANVIFDTQRLRLQNLAQASLISATQESIAKAYGDEEPVSPVGNSYTVQKTESGERIYVCHYEGCGRSFKASSHLKYHRETHAGQKVLKCSFDGCDKRFSWPAHRKYHMKTHLGDRPHRCELSGCNKSFYVYQRLKVHMRTHTGEKPYHCSQEGCGKGFSTAGNLKNHIRTHTGERPFLCNVQGCGRRFAEHSSLRKHKITHSGCKPYSCDICGKQFSQSGSRNAHRRRHLTTNTVDTPHNELNPDMMELRQGDEDVLQLQDVEFHHTSGSPGHSIESESVVLSQPVSDHVVTVTTQPSDNVHLGLSRNVLQTEDMHNGSLPSHTSAAVVVLSQPQHTVTMSSQGTTFHDPDTQQTTTEEIVYDSELLHSELDQNMVADNMHVTHCMSQAGTSVQVQSSKDIMNLGAIMETESSHNSDDDHSDPLGAPLQLVCEEIDGSHYKLQNVRDVD